MPRGPQFGYRLRLCSERVSFVRDLIQDKDMWRANAVCNSVAGLPTKAGATIEAPEILRFADYAVACIFRCAQVRSICSCHQAYYLFVMEKRFDKRRIPQHLGNISAGCSSETKPWLLLLVVDWSKANMGVGAVCMGSPTCAASPEVRRNCAGSDLCHSTWQFHCCLSASGAGSIVGDIHGRATV